MGCGQERNDSLLRGRYWGRGQGDSSSQKGAYQRSRGRASVTTGSGTDGVERDEGNDCGIWERKALIKRGGAGKGRREASERSPLMRHG